MNQNKPDSLDYMQALKVLYPYKTRLELIRNAEKNDEFETVEITDPWSAITYFRDSKAYHTYEIKKISLEIYEAVKTLPHYTYEEKTWNDIQEKIATDERGFESWELRDVYYYLQMLFEDLSYGKTHVDDIVIENAIIRGDILDIITCFLERI